MKVEQVKHLYGYDGRHWIEATIDGKRVRGEPTGYSFIAELGPLRAMTEYYGERVYTELAVEVEVKSVCTPYDENDPSRGWAGIWREETKKALEGVEVYQE